MVKDQATSAYEVDREDTTAKFASAAADINVVGAFDVDATGNISINSSAGTINVGNDAVAQNMNIGTGAAARTVTIGNATGATSLVANSGTGGVTVDSAGAIAINSSAGAINIGNDDVDQAMNIGTSGERTVTIGNSAGTGASTNVLIHGLKRATEVISAANSLLAADSGRTIFVTQGGAAFTISLPGAGAGFHYRFVLGTTSTASVTIAAGAATLMHGIVMAEVNATTVNAVTINDARNVNFIGSTAVKGDWIDIECDGIDWYVKAHTAAAGGITGS